ncbi:hypothetical protein HPG69_005745, partial [Diceros bicornis minor]
HQAPFLVSPPFLFCSSIFSSWLVLDFYTRISFYFYFSYSVPFYLPNHARICEQEKPKSGQHVDYIVELREAKLSPEEEQKRDLCLHHEEKLLLFCKEDGKVIYLLCKWFQEHHAQCFLDSGLITFSQEKLQAALERLRKEQQEAEKLEADVREKRISWKNQIQNEAQRVQAEFNQTRGVLDCEEQKELLNLKNKEADRLHNPADAENDLVQQSQLVRALISDVEHPLQGSTMEMLHVRHVKKSQLLRFEKMKTIHSLTGLPCLHPRERIVIIVSSFSSNNIIATFVISELTEVQCHWVPPSQLPILCLTMSQGTPILYPSPDPLIFPTVYLMLKLVNAFLNIVVAADKRQVTLVCFSGKYYCEVDVSRKIAWILRVYCESSNFNINKISEFIFGQKVHHPNTYSRYRRQNGYWVKGLQNESEYNADEDSSTSDPRVLTLSMAVPSHCIWIFLDYEAGTGSFFSVTNHGVAHLQIL